MTALRDLQAAFAAHLAGDDGHKVVEAVVGDSIPAAARLQVHRHHVRHSLANALAATFPTVEALVGADFFRALAVAFVERNLPAQPVLAEYGQGFAGFVADWQPAQGLPYLADVARLDWALNVAWHATDGERLAATDLAAEPAERLPLLRLVLSPGTSLLQSPYPVDRIWSASQPGAAAGEVALDGAVALLVLRQADDAGFLRLSPGETAFLAAVEAGASLETAAGNATATARDFDLSSVFARMLGLGCFAAMQH